jgi:hypothetical protein
VTKNKNENDHGNGGRRGQGIGHRSVRRRHRAGGVRGRAGQFKQSFAMEWTRKKQGNPPQPRRYGQVQPRVEKRDGFRLWSAWTTMVGRHVARLRYRRDTRPSQSMHVVEAAGTPASRALAAAGKVAPHTTHAKLNGFLLRGESLVHGGSESNVAPKR